MTTTQHPATCPTCGRQFVPNMFNGLCNYCFKKNVEANRLQTVPGYLQERAIKVARRVQTDARDAVRASETTTYRPTICRKCGGKMVPESRHPRGCSDNACMQCLDCDFRFDWYTTHAKKDAYIAAVKSNRKRGMKNGNP